jgi:hypothetical protein
MHLTQTIVLVSHSLFHLLHVQIPRFLLPAIAVDREVIELSSPFLSGELLLDSVDVVYLSSRRAAPSGSGIPLFVDMSKALEGSPFDRQEDSKPPPSPPI